MDSTQLNCETFIISFISRISISVVTYLNNKNTFKFLIESKYYWTSYDFSFGNTNLIFIFRIDFVSFRELHPGRDHIRDSFRERARVDIPT